MTDPNAADRDARRARFAELVRGEPVGLAEACLVMGGEADPGVEPGVWLAELDRLAEAVRGKLGGPAEELEPAQAAAVLALVLGVRAGFGGAEADYTDLRSSLLHEVLRRRRGLPILLSVVWIEVGRRAGLPVYGVALPGHFVVGVGDPDGVFVLADPFHGGRLLTVDDARGLALGAGGSPDDPHLFAPAQPIAVLLRILNNIRVWAQNPAQAPERAWTRLWAVELSLLLPRHPAALRRERGSLLVLTGDFLGGAAELEDFGNLVGAIDKELAEVVRTEARAARARLN
ncbi:transglutaminase-like domain-containing protein [Yinghuangia seranimata]|uniref:transglutaminase-like domain-containing protein n=1 Tax=Yinghuangia seranimata TaxID=408067 RepID=UPI00248C9D2D|nr:transglutaminase-like domain-containing protein [Yinghuangia seranimata]MDI2128932.1 transglutaminase-like domain-containing protein [Yinghuangia seranimata]